MSFESRWFGLRGHCVHTGDDSEEEGGGGSSGATHSFEIEKPVRSQVKSRKGLPICRSAVVHSRAGNALVG